MANILIIDDNKAVSAFLKLLLLRQQHQVSRSREVAEATGRARGFAPDLVLINRSFKNDSGWQVFNDLKRMDSDLPAMVYVLEDLTLQNADWIARAMDAALKESGKGTRLRWTKKTG